MKIKDYLNLYPLMTPENIQTFPFYGTDENEKVENFLRDFFGGREIFYGDEFIVQEVQQKILTLFNINYSEYNRYSLITNYVYNPLEQLKNVSIEEKEYIANSEVEKNVNKTENSENNMSNETIDTSTTNTTNITNSNSDVTSETSEIVTDATSVLTENSSNIDIENSVTTYDSNSENLNDSNVEISTDSSTVTNSGTVTTETNNSENTVNFEDGTNDTISDSTSNSFGVTTDLVTSNEIDEEKTLEVVREKNIHTETSYNNLNYYDLIDNEIRMSKNNLMKIISHDIVNSITYSDYEY